MRENQTRKKSLINTIFYGDNNITTNQSTNNIRAIVFIGTSIYYVSKKGLGGFRKKAIFAGIKYCMYYADIVNRWSKKVQKCADVMYESYGSRLSSPIRDYYKQSPTSTIYRQMINRTAFEGYRLCTLCMQYTL